MTEEFFSLYCNFTSFLDSLLIQFIYRMMVEGKAVVERRREQMVVGLVCALQQMYFNSYGRPGTLNFYFLLNILYFNWFFFFLYICYFFYHPNGVLGKFHHENKFRFHSHICQMFGCCSYIVFILFYFLLFAQ